MLLLDKLERLVVLRELKLRDQPNFEEVTEDIILHLLFRNILEFTF